MTMTLSTKIENLNGVGPAIAASLHALEIYTVGDLLMFFPKAYDDFSKISKVGDLSPGQATIKVTLADITSGYRNGGLHITSASALDDTGAVKVSWFNQPYRSKAIKPDTEYYVSGLLEFKYGSYQMINPAVELVKAETDNTAKIVPKYKERKNLKSHAVRKIMANAMEACSEIVDSLPSVVLEQEGLMSKAEAIRQLHMPESVDSLESAKRRLGFEEVFELQLAALYSKAQAKQFLADRLTFDAESTSKFLANLSFKLTDAQRKAAWQILQDIDKTAPMNRLLQGDVGSGKTIVAGMAIEQCLRAGKQAALMAPTEVLAAQHAKTLSTLLGNDKVELITSQTKSATKSQIIDKATSGKAQLFVGTHALIQKSVQYENLGLAIIDEQHRFGVDQRQKLLVGKKMPHLLSMTATPIPRSLALTVYGDLDISVIDELPPGRKPVETVVKPFTAVEEIDRLIDESVRKKQQVYIVCPLIEESDKLALKNAQAEYERVRSRHKIAKVGLLHGKLKSDEKQSVLDDFKNGSLDIIVTTTVIEVGVDVPKASLMVIEGAERFGLAQLHQLRGRVGRSDIQSKCVLVTSAGVRPSTRLRAMEQTNSGFKLSEIDLELRGPGAIYGKRQHGILDLAMANLGDTKLTSHIRSVAQTFLDSNPDLSQYPLLLSKINKLRSITQLN